MIDQVHFAAIKARLSDVPGIEGLSVSNTGGRLEFGMAGKIAATRDDAPDAEIESAIRIIFGTTNPAAAAPIAPAPAPTTEAKVSVTGTGNVGQRLKDMMAAHRAKVAQLLDDSIANVQAGMDKEIQGIQAVNKLGDKIHASGDDILSNVGQFTNDLGID